MKARVDRVLQIQALPDSVARIIKLLNNLNARTEEISREIAKDPAFSAQVLKLVNSGFYGFSQPVTSIAHATVLLGFNVMKTIVLSASVLGLMSASMSRFWKHSLACARTCVLLARRLGAAEPEEYSAAGLLHDIGKIVMAQYLKEEFQAVMALVEPGGCLFLDAERRALGVTHTDVARWLLEKWKLPPETVAPIIHHHALDPAGPHARRVAIVHLADILVRAEGIGSGDDLIPALDPAAMTLLKLDVSHLRGIMDEMRVELFELG
jgi:putative nucleotidyltransferase with HDIG domain